MKKELQDYVWQKCLPAEFKKEVKKEWQTANNEEKLPHDAFLRGCYSTMVLLFGVHNLTSDAEGEDELLIVPRSKVQGKWQRAYENESEYAKAEQNPTIYAELYYNRGILSILDTLFGSKCLPDDVDSVEQLEPKANSDYTPIPEKTFISKWDKTEPKPAEPEEPTCSDDCPSQCPSHLRNLSQESANCDKEFDNILSDSFRDHNRLHIASMALAGLLANPYWVERKLRYALKQYESHEAAANDFIKEITEDAAELADGLLKEFYERKTDKED